MTDYGTDISTFSNGDLDPYFSLTSGVHVVAEAVARRFVTPRNGGLFYDPSYGFDLRGYLNGTFTAAQLAMIAPQIEIEALKDERVQSATATVSLTAGVMRVSLRLTTAAGPFSLVLAISQVGITILEVST